MNSFADPRSHPDEQLAVVADESRRRLLFALLDEDPRGDAPVEIDDWVTEIDPSESLTVMQHTHLPKLEDRGLIRWGRETGRVRRGPKYGEIEPLLTVLDDHLNGLPDEWE